MFCNLSSFQMLRSVPFDQLPSPSQHSILSLDLPAYEQCGTSALHEDAIVDVQVIINSVQRQDLQGRKKDI